MKVINKVMGNILELGELPVTKLDSESKPVYWVEKNGYPKFEYAVHSGYVLAMYRNHFGLFFLVSLGGYNSCVVRHINVDDLFVDIKTANARCIEMNQRGVSNDE